VIVLTFISLLCIGLFVTIKEFVQNPIVTTTSYATAKWIDFPSVYICPPDVIDVK
jgi:hypothetical protein